MGEFFFLKRFCTEQRPNLNCHIRSDTSRQVLRPADETAGLRDDLSKRHYGLALLDFQRLLELESKRRLGRKNDIFVAGESGAAGSRTSSGKGADSRAFASAR